MLKHIDFYTALRELTLAPGSIPTAPNEVRESKIQSALARLGDRWVLAPTRKRQLDQLKAEGRDLV